MNKSAAARYYKLAADQGIVDAQYMYAKQNRDGDGVAVNKSEAAKYYKMASENGNMQARIAYEEMLANGEIIISSKSALKV